MKNVHSDWKYPLLYEIFANNSHIYNAHLYKNIMTI